MPPKKQALIDISESWTLLPENSDELTQIDLHLEKLVVLGRNEVTNEDKKLSRRQIEVKLTKDQNNKQSVVVKRVGSKPTTYTKKNEEGILESEVTLGNGDSFSLLGNKYVYKIQQHLVEEKKIEVKKQNVLKDGEQEKKKPQIQLENEDDDDIPLIENGNKRKIEKVVGVNHQVEKKKKEKLDAHEEISIDQIGRKKSPNKLKKQQEKEEKEKQEQMKRIEEADLLLALKLQPRQCVLCLEERDIDFFQNLKMCNHEFCRLPQWLFC